MKQFRIEFSLPPFGLTQTGVRAAIRLEADNATDAMRVATWILHPAAQITAVKEVES